MEFLSSNIKFLRKKHQLSIEELAAKLKVTEKKVQQVEKDPSKVSLSLVLLAAKYFKVPLDSLIHINLPLKESKAKVIKLLVLDVDGVLTDGGMYYAEDGVEYKKFNSKDGLAIKGLVKSGMQVAFLSNGINAKLIKNRAKLLGVQRVYVGLDEKELILDKWVKELKITYKNVAYIGDDLNDLKVIKKAGFSACPSDASEKVKASVSVILTRKGGDTCVRELIDHYFSK